jgi:tight adherence protein C
MTLAALAIALMIGTAVALLVWGVYGIFAAVPSQDRTYLDRPALGFRLVWPIIQLLVYYFAPLLSRPYRIRTQARLRRAGTDYSLSPEQFFASKVIGALVAVGITLMLEQMLDARSPLFLGIAAIGGFCYPELWVREATNKREKDILKTLPFYLDILTLSVEAGSNLIGGLTQGVQKSPEGPLRAEISRVLRDVRAGKPRAEALRNMAERVQIAEITSLVSSLVQAEKVGASLGPVLRTQADQRRTERFLRAEKVAMEAPVKLLGPLIIFIFPNTFLVLSFVLIVKAVQGGVVTWAPLLWALSWPG